MSPRRKRAKDKAPAFQFYVRDFMADANVQAMTWDEIGMYVWLMCVYWNERELPNDRGRIMRILKVTDDSVATRVWSAIVPCFEQKDGKLSHPRLDKERRKRLEWERKSSEGGRASAALRRSKGGVKGGSTVDERPLEPNANTSSSSSSSEDQNQLTLTPLRVVDDKAAERKTEEDARQRRFDRFWAVYPNKVKKPQAVKAWAKVDPDDALTDVVVAAVERHAQTSKWVKDNGEFIPYPATWLNARQWEDKPAVEVRETVDREAIERKRVEAERRDADRVQQQQDNLRREEEADAAAADILKFCPEASRIRLRQEATTEVRQTGMWGRMPEAAREQAVIAAMKRIIREKSRGPALFELRDRLRRERRGAA
jgi:uncharacterized protein YdaU (DUF1376 family)